MQEELEGLEGHEEGPIGLAAEYGLSRVPGVAQEVERASHTVIGCAIEVHRCLGPGLLEKLYEDALVHELGLAGVAVERQKPITVHYKGIELRGQRLDLVAAGSIVVEIKAVSQLMDVHKAQLVSYLRASGLPLGLLLNFNVSTLKSGLRRVVNDRMGAPPSCPSSPSSSACGGTK